MRFLENDNKMSNPERVGMPANYMLPQSSSGTLISQRSFDKQHIKQFNINIVGLRCHEEKSI